MATVLSALLVTSCAWVGGSTEGGDIPNIDSPDPLCRTLSIPMKHEGPDLSFEQLVQQPDEGVTGLTLVFGSKDRANVEAELRPALDYLAHYAAASIDPPAGPIPRLTSEVEVSARAIDRELAAGRCR